MNKTAIETADYTWNPVSGCNHGCSWCYARTIAARFYPKDIGFAPHFYPGRLSEPAKAKKPSKIFTVSMGDLFGDWVPTLWIAAVLEQVYKNPQHTFQFLTKNPKRLKDFNPWPTNCWVGTTVTNQADADERLPWLLKVDASVLFVSHEPLLGQIDVAPWLQGEGDVTNKYGRNCLSGRSNGGITDRRGRPYLEDSSPEVEPMGESHGVNPLQDKAGRKHEGGLSANPGDVRIKENLCPGSQGSLEALQRANSAGADHQSQERENPRERPHKPGTGDLFGTTETRHGSPGAPAQPQRERSISWCIIGSMTGPGAAKPETEWVMNLAQQYKAAGVPLFLKDNLGFKDQPQEFPA
jgi:protein gp37